MSEQDQTVLYLYHIQENGMADCATYDSPEYDCPKYLRADTCITKAEHEAALKAQREQIQQKILSLYPEFNSVANDILLMLSELNAVGSE